MSELATLNINPDLFARFKQAADKLSGGGSGMTTRRISIKGGKFRQMVNGEQIKVSKDGELNIIIVDAAPLSRTYYEGAYDPTNPAPPACWSNDTNTRKPSDDVAEPQARSCDDCKQNIKGSGQGNSRACRFGQRLAVALEGDLSTVYQLQLPATSIFGDAHGEKMPMQAYSRFLAANGAPPAAVVTTMFFDEDAEVPKLYFRAARPLSAEELEQVGELLDSEDTKRAVEFTVAQTDKLIASDKPAPKKAKAVEPEEEVEEPKKVARKPKAEEPSDLGDILDEWDDE